MFAKVFQIVYASTPGDDDLFTFIDNRDDSNCFSISFTPATVHSVLRSMDIKKGSGFGGISSIFLR